MSTGHVNVFGPPAPRLGMSIVSANGPLGTSSIFLLLWLTGASMFALGMTLKGIRIKTGVFLHQGTISQALLSKENEITFTLEFTLDSNISFTSWLAVLDEVSRKQVQQQRCIEAILRSSSVSHRTEAAINLHDHDHDHSACWCCLFEAPEHVLSCGHVLCTPCVKAYGH